MLLIKVEIRAAMNHQLIHLVERARIEQQIEALPGSELALFVLLINAVLSCIVM